jgi:hypothetical protein
MPESRFKFQHAGSPPEEAAVEEKDEKCSRKNAPQNGAGLHSVCGQGGIFLGFRGGEFSTGEMGNFQSALTVSQVVKSKTITIRYLDTHLECSWPQMVCNKDGCALAPS